MCVSILFRNFDSGNPLRHDTHSREGECTSKIDSLTKWFDITNRLTTDKLETWKTIKNKLVAIVPVNESDAHENMK